MSGELHVLERYHWYVLASQIPRWLSDEESDCQFKRCGFSPWVRKIPWRREWQPTLVFLPRESQGQRSLMGYTVHKTVWWAISP